MANTRPCRTMEPQIFTETPCPLETAWRGILGHARTNGLLQWRREAPASNLGNKLDYARSEESAPAFLRT